MIKESKQHVIKHLNAQDFDEVAEILLLRVSNNFLDKALARRLETIPARQLVNSLARAERLGYDLQDLVEEKHGAEHVIPSLPPMKLAPSVPSQPIPSTTAPHPPNPTPMTFISQQPGQQSTEGPHGSVRCVACLWPCSAQEALDYVCFVQLSRERNLLTSCSIGKSMPAARSKTLIVQVGTFVPIVAVASEVQAGWRTISRQWSAVGIRRRRKK